MGNLKYVSTVYLLQSPHLHLDKICIDCKRHLNEKTGTTPPYALLLMCSQNQQGTRLKDIWRGSLPRLAGEKLLTYQNAIEFCIQFRRSVYWENSYSYPCQGKARGIWILIWMCHLKKAQYHGGRAVSQLKVELQFAIKFSYFREFLKSTKVQFIGQKLNFNFCPTQGLTFLSCNSNEVQRERSGPL